MVLCWPRLHPPLAVVVGARQCQRLVLVRVQAPDDGERPERWRRRPPARPASWVEPGRPRCRGPWPRTNPSTSTLQSCRGGQTPLHQAACLHQLEDLDLTASKVVVGFGPGTGSGHFAGRGPPPPLPPPRRVSTLQMQVLSTVLSSSAFSHAISDWDASGEVPGGWCASVPRSVHRPPVQEASEKGNLEGRTLCTLSTLQRWPDAPSLELQRWTRRPFFAGRVPPPPPPPRSCRGGQTPFTTTSSSGCCSTSAPGGGRGGAGWTGCRGPGGAGGGRRGCRRARAPGAGRRRASGPRSTASSGPGHPCSTVSAKEVFPEGNRAQGAGTGGGARSRGPHGSRAPPHRRETRPRAGPCPPPSTTSLWFSASTHTCRSRRRPWRRQGPGPGRAAATRPAAPRRALRRPPPPPHPALASRPGGAPGHRVSSGRR